MAIEPIDSNRLPGEDNLAIFLKKRLDDWSKERESWEKRWETSYKRANNVYEKELGETEGEEWRSRLFYPITRNKIRVAVALVADTVFQQNRIPFELNTTPITDSEDSQAFVGDLQIDPKKRVENMKILLDDQFIESKLKDELSTCILSAARLGTGAMKGPVVEYKIRNRWKPIINESLLPNITPEEEDPKQHDLDLIEVLSIAMENVHYELDQIERPVPAGKVLDIWDLFPDPDHENVQDGLGVYERAILSKEELAKLGTVLGVDGKPIYNIEAIKALLDASPDEYNDTYTRNRGPHRQDFESRRGYYSVFTYSGQLTKKDLQGHIPFENYEDESSEDPLDEYQPLEVIVTFCRNRILRAEINPYPKQIRPYHIFAWSRVEGSPWGWGIADELEHAQRGFNGFLRLYIDNKRLAGSMGFAMDESQVENPNETIRPGFRFRTEPGVSPGEVIKEIIFRDIGGSLLEAMSMCEDWANSASGIPPFLEGDQLASRTNTAYEASELKASALKQLGLPISYLDERVIVPMCEAFYYWNMANHEDEKVKGDFEIRATGFSTFKDKTLRGIELRNLLSLAGQDPELAQKINKEAIIRELAKIGELPEGQFIRSDQEQQEIEQANAEAAQSQIDQQLQAVREEFQKEISLLQLKFKDEELKLKLKHSHESSENEKDRKQELTKELLRHEGKHQPQTPEHSLAEVSPDDSRA